LIDPVVDELGSRDAINGVRKIMETGTGADRQLKVFEESKGDLKAVVDYMGQRDSGRALRAAIQHSRRRHAMSARYTPCPSGASDTIYPYYGAADSSVALATDSMRACSHGWTQTQAMTLKHQPPSNQDESGANENE